MPRGRGSQGTALASLPTLADSAAIAIEAPSFADRKEATASPARFRANQRRGQALAGDWIDQSRRVAGGDHADNDRARRKPHRRTALEALHH
jgi:hypothetical protein